MGIPLTPERIAAIQRVIHRRDMSRDQMAAALRVNRSTVRDYVTRFGAEKRSTGHPPPHTQPRRRGEISRRVYGTDRLEDLAWGVTFTPPDPVGRRV